MKCSSRVCQCLLLRPLAPYYFRKDKCGTWKQKIFSTPGRLLTSHGKHGKSADCCQGKVIAFFWKMAKLMWKSHGIYSLVPRIFSNHGGQFKGNSSNLRSDLTMGTVCVIDLSLVCYIMFEIDFLHGFDTRKVLENMGKVMESMSKTPV